MNASKPLRSYCHPMDATLIRFLDNPATNLLVKKIVDVSADANYGQVIAAGIPVNERSFPEINVLVEHCAKLLRIRKPYVVVSSSIGFNAFTIGSDKEPYVVLGSMLLKTMTREQLEFIIGHECGHVAMGHLVYHTAVNLISRCAVSIPVIGELVNCTAGVALKAWSRRSEITADRAGLLCCGSLEVAQKALLQLEMGLVNDGRVDVEAYLENSAAYRNASIIRKLGEYVCEHPLLPKRIKALEMFLNSELIYCVAGQEPPEGLLDGKALRTGIDQLVRVL